MAQLELHLMLCAWTQVQMSNGFRVKDILFTNLFEIQSFFHKKKNNNHIMYKN